MKFPPVLLVLLTVTILQLVKISVFMLLVNLHPGIINGSMSCKVIFLSISAVVEEAYHTPLVAKNKFVNITYMQKFSVKNHLMVFKVFGGVM